MWKSTGIQQWLFATIATDGDRRPFPGFKTSPASSRGPGSFAFEQANGLVQQEELGSLRDYLALVPLNLTVPYEWSGDSSSNNARCRRRHREDHGATLCCRNESNVGYRGLRAMV